LPRIFHACPVSTSLSSPRAAREPTASPTPAGLRSLVFGGLGLAGTGRLLRATEPAPDDNQVLVPPGQLLLRRVPDEVIGMIRRGLLAGGRVRAHRWRFGRRLGLLRVLCCVRRVLVCL